MTRLLRCSLAAFSVASLLICTTAGRDDHNELTASTFEFPTWVEDLHGLLGGGEVVDYNHVPIPTNEQAARLPDIIQEDDGKENLEAEVLDMTIRYSALAYSRNSGEKAQYILMSSGGTGKVDMIEMQFHGTPHRESGAHLVVYLYKIPGGGAGAALSFKGSTLSADRGGLNWEDWKHNLQVIPASLLGKRANDYLDSKPTAAKATVHAGFLRYMYTLTRTLSQVSLEVMNNELHSVLKEWDALPAPGSTFDDDRPRWGPPPKKGEEYKQMSLYRWLFYGGWKWCFVTGHSLGGAMAQIAAAKIGVYSGKRPFLATLGTPTAGDGNFVKTLEEHVSPGGGIRIHNSGDLVSAMGHQLLLGEHSGYNVTLNGRTGEWLSAYHIHLRYTFYMQHKNGKFNTETAKLVTLQFPGTTYYPQGAVDEVLSPEVHEVQAIRGARPLLSMSRQRVERE